MTTAKCIYFLILILLSKTIKIKLKTTLDEKLNMFSLATKRNGTS